MRGIILAGGLGSRLLPATQVTNKHLLPVGRKPMILHVLDRLREVAQDIMVITGTGHAGHIMGLLGSGKNHGVRFTYRVQDEAGGIAQALGLCEEFVGQDRCAVMLGDNIFSRPLPTWQPTSDCAAICLAIVRDPSRFGCPVFAKDGASLLRIEEKPRQPASKYAVTGFYLYPPSVFKIIRDLKPSARSELEITDVNNAFLSQGRLNWVFYEHPWCDAGTWESLFEAGRMMEGGT
jgi:glucose-1-phosphate thymidylyltransferase